MRREYCMRTLQQRGLERNLQRGHAGGASQRAESMLNNGCQFLERVVCRVGISGIAEAFFLVPENAIQSSRRIVEISCAEVNGRGRRHDAALAFTVAGMHDLRFDVHFLFQRTPSLVSS